MRVKRRGATCRFPGFRAPPWGTFPRPWSRSSGCPRSWAGRRIFIKRDDCTGLALGGNKTRKLEFLCAEALAEGADTLITAGGLQSNHVRQTAAAANRLGRAGHLMLQRQADWHEEAYLRSGNLLLDGLLGASPHFPPPGAPRDQEMARLAEELRAAGARPYVIPGGGSNPVGGLGYAAAAGEILDQAAAAGVEIGHLVVPSGSGGTQGGLIAGLAVRGAAVRVTGIDVDGQDPGLEGKVLAVAEGTAALLGLGQLALSSAVSVAGGYSEAYGKPTEEMLAALRLLAKLEGILLDPVYTGKAMAGLMGMVEKGAFEDDGVVVFVHTGGAPGLFAYASLFPGIVPAGV